MISPLGPSDNSEIFLGVVCVVRCRPVRTPPISYTHLPDPGSLVTPVSSLPMMNRCNIGPLLPHNYTTGSPLLLPAQACSRVYFLRIFLPVVPVHLTFPFSL